MERPILESQKGICQIGNDRKQAVDLNLQMATTEIHYTQKVKDIKYP